MTPTVLASQSIAAIGTFLTLTSLLGTFFYVQLSTWLRDLLTLRSKFDLNEGGTTPDEQKALREVRYTLKGLFNFLPLLVTIAISAFIGFAAWNAFAILEPFRAGDPIAARLADALCVFLVIYTILIVFLLIRGYLIGWNLSKKFG
jgi:H+/Cl- antiporter ClcA